MRVVVQVQQMFIIPKVATLHNYAHLQHCLCEQLYKHLQSCLHLIWHTRWNVSLIFWIPPKRAHKKHLQRGSKTWTVIGGTFCLSHSSGSIRFDTTGCKSLRLLVGVRDDNTHTHVNTSCYAGVKQEHAVHQEMPLVSFFFFFFFF